MAGVDEGVEDVSDMAEALYVTTADHAASVDMVRVEAATAAAAVAAAMQEMKEKMDEKIYELQMLIDNNQHGARPREDRPREGLTTRRAFSQLSSYSGKPEEYDDWAFQMRRFLSEEKDFKELMFKLKAMTAIPNKHDVAKLVRRDEFGKGRW